jgi:hypothetical protein
MNNGKTTAKKVTKTTAKELSSKGTIRSAKSGRFTLQDLKGFEKDTSETAKAIIKSMRATYKNTHTGEKRAKRA